MNDLKKPPVGVPRLGMASGDTKLDLRRVLRDLVDEVLLYPYADTAHHQLITKAIEAIQACRYCAFEKEQQFESERLANIMRPLPKRGDE